MSVPAAPLQSLAKPPAAKPDKPLADTWARISERQQKKAATAATLAQAQTLLTDLHGDAAKRLVLRATTSTTTIYHVRAVDVLSAKVSKLRDVPLCDSTGELIPVVKFVRPSRVLLADLLSSTVELLCLPEAGRPGSKFVVPTMNAGVEVAEQPAEAIKYKLSSETDSEAASPHEYPP